MKYIIFVLLFPISVHAQKKDTARKEYRTVEYFSFDRMHAGDRSEDSAYRFKSDTTKWYHKDGTPLKEHIKWHSGRKIIYKRERN